MFGRPGSGEEEEPLAQRDWLPLLRRSELLSIDGGITEAVRDKSVLITGAGGSIGRHLAEEVARAQPRRLALLDLHEHSLYRLEQHLRSVGLDGRVDLELGDVREERKIRSLLRRIAPDVVFHLAAYKHVDLGESQAEELFSTNVLGTYNLARWAAEGGVEALVYPSSDKAVQPPSLYGATKRLCELIMRWASRRYTTRFVTVRLVNVMGSSGSVLETFATQLRRGQSLTITHPEMVRYWMTVSESVGLLLLGHAVARSGSVIYLDVGPPIAVMEIARNLAESLEVPQEKLSVRIVGARKGEKLREAMASPSEVVRPWENSPIREIVHSSLDRLASDMPLYLEGLISLWEGERTEDLGLEMLALAGRAQ